MRFLVALNITQTKKGGNNEMELILILIIVALLVGLGGDRKFKIK